MFYFIKSSFRRRALRGVKPFNGVKQEFPQMGKDMELGILCKVDNMADVVAFEEMVQFLKGFGRLDGAVVEGKKCFKAVGAREEFEEFCKRENILFLSKGCTDWKGMPDSQELEGFYSRKRDMMITINPEMDFTLDYIAKCAASGFTTAIHPTSGVPYNLVLEPGEQSLTFREYAEKLLGYIEMMQQ